MRYLDSSLNRYHLNISFWLSLKLLKWLIKGVFRVGMDRLHSPLHRQSIRLKRLPCRGWVTMAGPYPGHPCWDPTHMDTLGTPNALIQRVLSLVTTHHPRRRSPAPHSWVQAVQGPFWRAQHDQQEKGWLYRGWAPARQLRRLPGGMSCDNSMHLWHEWLKMELQLCGFPPQTHNSRLTMRKTADKSHVSDRLQNTSQHSSQLSRSSIKSLRNTWYLH